MQEDPMQEGDHVAVTVSDEVVGTGRIVKAGDVTVSVLVERPHGGPYPFGAPRAWFQPVGPKAVAYRHASHSARGVNGETARGRPARARKILMKNRECKERPEPTGMCSGRQGVTTGLRIVPRLGFTRYNNAGTTNLVSAEALYEKNVGGCFAVKGERRPGVVFRGGSSPGPPSLTSQGGPEQAQNLGRQGQSERGISTGERFPRSASTPPQKRRAPKFGFNRGALTRMSGLYESVLRLK